MISPVAFELFGYEVRWYSLLILIGVIIAYFLIKTESNRFQLKGEFVFNLMFWTIIFGIVGARLYYVLFNLSYYKDNLSEIVKVWNGGLAIHGGLIAGLLIIVLYCNKYKVNTKKVLDIVVPAVILGQAIGRWGNFFNGEAFGGIVEYKTLVNMKFIPQFVIDNMYINEAYHLPMFYFESLFCLLGFIIMLIIRRRKYIKNGQVFGFYLIWYGILRFFIEIFRTDALMIGNIKVAQLVSIIMVLIGIYINASQIRKPKLDDLYNSVEKDIIF